MSLLSPEIDLLIENARYHRGRESASRELSERMRACQAQLERIEPLREGRDSIWSLWIRSERGRLQDFGAYEEFRDAGEVDSVEEFEELWRLEYPDEVQWRRLRVIRYRDRLFFHLDGKFEIEADLSSTRLVGIDVTQDDCRRLVVWLLDRIRREVQRFVKDPEAYNREVERDLPLSRRLGRIRRRDLWQAALAPIRLDDELGQKKLELFAQVVGGMDAGAVLEELTLADYLGFCGTCYRANDYPGLEPSMTPRKMYRAMADNRDAGLLEIPPRDAAAFARWYRERQLGAHPWEICRGGNRTHISLQVVPRENGWQLILAGFSTARAVETARMAIALFERGVPFVLGHHEEMLRMLTGEDQVGIVPGDIPVGYNHGDFPAEDRIHSFVHLEEIEDACGSFPDGIVWYPMTRLAAAS